MFTRFHLKGKENSMGSSTIWVSGFPDDTTERELTIYFQSERDSGGGDVDSIEIDRGRAVIIFEDEQAAARVFDKPNHLFRNCPLQVSLLPNQGGSTLKKEPPDSIQGNGSHGYSTRSEKKSRPKASNSENDSHGKTTRFEQKSRPKASSSFDDHQSDLSRGGSDLLKAPEDFNGTAPYSSPQCTISVVGLPDGATEDLVLNYFENRKRSMGGPVSNVEISPELHTCKVTFESPDDAFRTVEHSPHKLSGACLQVSLFEDLQEENPDSFDENAEEFEEGITIIISDILPSTTEDAVSNYFENARRSGGGDVHKMEYNRDKGEAVITFLEVKDLERLLEGPHSINRTPITVKRQPPKKKVPPDPVRIHVQGIREETTADCLCFYLEKFSGIDVKEVYFGSNNNALVVFDEEPDFQTLFDKVHKDTKGLEGRKPRLERVPVCTSILVTGLRDESTDDTIQLYFENEKRSGGTDVSKVERIWKDEAVVSFDDPSCVQNVIQRRHTLEGNKLNVTPHYPFLKDTTTKKAEIAFDPDILGFIQMNHERELQMALEECKAQIELSKDCQASVIIVSTADKRNDSDQSWTERTGQLASFLQSFKKSELLVASEIFDEIVQRWKEQVSAEGSSDFLVSFDEHKRLVQIIGKKAHVDKEQQKLQDLIHSVTEDTELMKTVVQVVEDNIPTSKLKLLEMSGICERLRNDQRHLSIAVDSNGQKLNLKGPRNLLQEVKIEVFTFISKVDERTTELPVKVINVLRRPQVSRFIQDLFKQNDIQAVVLYDQGQSFNEVKLVGVDPSNTKKAENLLQGAIQENSLLLTIENAQVLKSRIWSEFQASFSPNFKVGITVDSPSSTIWVSGIAHDVEECFEEVKRFIEKNTILSTIIQTEQGTTRFLSEVWKTKVEDIKRELVDCSFDVRVTADGEGIEVSGSADGLNKGVPLVHALINSVLKDSVPIDKPGMKKLFLEGKGPVILKATEQKHRCIILPTERANEDNLAIDIHSEADQVVSAQKLICSYLTKEEKKISVFKGDITKDHVDAIVNAANSELKHMGGLAAAIVQAGGKEIQDECDHYIRDHGSLLEGQTMVSKAGKLPCNRVIHAVGPKWDSAADKQAKEGKQTKQERYLKFAITSSLKEASKLRSIAIPAVSSGVFGFPRDLCAAVILDAVLDFCEENQACNLSDIHLINNDDNTVAAFAKEMKKRFAAERNFKDEKQSTGPASFGFGAKSHESGTKMKKTPRSLTTKGFRITVKVGDLAKEQADIIVGTAASNLNLNQNPCANALSQAAGPRLQQECTRIGRVDVGDIAVNNQPGNLNCRAVIFAICSEWNNGKGKKVLKTLLAKCLQKASAQGMRSIAFPAIGTGTLQFPRSEVAAIYFDEVLAYNQKNPASSIKEVRFVLYDQDDPTVQAFDAELKKRGEISTPFPARKLPDSFEKPINKPAKDFQSSLHETAAFSPLRERDHDHLETNVGYLCFKVKQEDIIEETTDAIVVISNKDLDIGRGGGAGAAILKAGGKAIQRECSKKGPQLPGSVVITKAGDLKTRFIFHIVPSEPLSEKGIQASIMKCLQEAESKGLSSISFPAIGTGNLGIPAKASANIMLSAIREFSDQQPTSMQLIKMVIFQKEMMKDVRSAIEEASGETSLEKPGLLRRIFSRVGDVLGLGTSDKKAPSAAAVVNDYDLIFFAGRRQDLEAAVNEINELIKEKSTKQSIENEAITNLSIDHLRRIHTFELRYDVEASVEKEVGRIVVRGQTDDVFVVIREIYKILDHVKEDEHERKRAEVLSKDIQWMYKDVDTDMFVNFEPRVNAKIEAAYDEKKDEAITLGEGHKVDFTSMTEKDVFGYDVAEVKRVDRRGIQSPDYWDPQPQDQNGKESEVHCVPLDSRSMEFKKIHDKVKGGCSNIVKIERIQNPTLHRLYVIQKQKMDEANGSNEKWLCHGTAGVNCDPINHGGFDRSYSWQKNTLYGKGVYFAKDASYSASSYSPRDRSTGLRHMYLAKVLVGEYTLGKPDILVAPRKNSSDPTDTYDSVVDKIPDPSIFVVFRDFRSYPEYLITFQ